MKTTTPSTDLTNFFLGIDVGKRELFCHLVGPKQLTSVCFENTPTGIRLLLKWLRKNASIEHLYACLEETGHYGDAVAIALHNHGLAGLHLVNPQRIKAYGNQKLRRNKSDRADAKLIARFIESEHRNLHQWEPRSPDQQSITELSRYADSMTQDNARLKTKLEAQPEILVTNSLKRRIKAQEKEIKALRERIATLIKGNAELAAKSKVLKSIPGLGEISTQTVIAELPDLNKFNDARQLAAWIGLTPRHFESGTSGKTRTPITKIGSIHLRRALFMPAMTARVFNPLLKIFADRLVANGKKPKQVIIAVMRKLAHQIYGILKSGQPYNPEKRGYMGSMNSTPVALHQI